MHTKGTKLYVFATIALVLVVIFVFVILPRLNGPSSGTALNPSIVNDASAKQLVFDFTPRTVLGTYASFTVPTSLQDTPSSKLVGPDLEKHDFMYRDVATWVLAIDVLRIPSGRLSDNGSYTYEKVYPAIYEPSQETINGHSVPVMTNKTVGGFQKIAYLVYGPYQAEISLYGDDASGSDKLQATFDMILSSWQWLAR